MLFRKKSPGRKGGRAGDPAAHGTAAVNLAVIADAMVARANALRDQRQWRSAAVLYDEVLRIRPDAALHVQCGHMHKEAGDLAQAEAQYRKALGLLPDDADLALQLGHLFKVAGRVREAEASYARAAALQPGWEVPAAELRFLRTKGWRPALAEANDTVPGFSAEADALRQAASHDLLVPEIVPRKRSEMFHPHHESLDLRRFGRRERSFWGVLPTFRGVEALRGFCISTAPVLEMQVSIDGLLIHRGPVKGGYALQYERENPDLLKYTFNVWLDFSAFLHGRYEIELRFIRAGRDARVHREQVVVAAPLREADHPGSDAILSLPQDDNRTVEQQVNARPSVVRPAQRAVFPTLPKTVLILRTDQLGDMVTSIPAIQRLRELLPQARLVALMTASNAGFAATLGLFDEIVEVDFPDDLLDRRRTMPLAEQAALRERLAAYRFDLALDLAESSMSRPLLLLSGAPFLYGFYDRDWPWLTAGFEGATHDPKNDREIAPHSTRVLACVERLGALLHGRAEVMRRTDLSRDRLRAYGLPDRDRFAVLHTGARIAFSRWPHYGALAALLLARTDLRVVLLADDAAAAGTLPEEVLASDRFHLLTGRLPFDDLDALLSFCSAFVGNDSGPKHLAALRGANVVSLHAARVNWAEWGQEMSGCIISRKVPCAGCSIYHDADECGQDYACITEIRVQEVLAAVMALL